MVNRQVFTNLKTVEPGQLLICRQKATSGVLYGHVNAFGRNLPAQCFSNLARDTHRNTVVQFLDYSTLPQGEGWNQPGAKFQPGPSAMRHVNAAVNLCSWRVETRPGSNSTRVETPHVNIASMLNN